MTTVLVSPDYLSHYRPLSVLGWAVAAAGDRVVVATGASLRPRVLADGFEWRQLRLGPASNPGLVTAEDPGIPAFLAATRSGPVATIAHQARKRQRDLLWEPQRVAARLRRIVDELDPDRVVVDHVSFGSTLAAHAIDRPFVTLVPGHPTQLPIGTERYGLPPQWPSAMWPDASELAAVEELLDRVAAAFTARWNEALASIAPDAAPVADAYRVHGHLVLHNAVAGLQDPRRSALLADDIGARHRFVGPLVDADRRSPGRRRADFGPEPRAWGPRRARRPRVYVALGTFLANRGDVLVEVAAGLRRLGAQAAIATGPLHPRQLGPVPDDWIVGSTLPQVELLDGADVAINHGGNNSVMEAIASGCRQIVLPFSTDQFANGADLEQRAGAVVLAPNEVTPDDMAAAVATVLTHRDPIRETPLPRRDLADILLG